MADPVPVIDYTSKDYSGFRSSLLDYASTVFPQWTQASEGDFGIVLTELFAYVGDVLSYYGDRIASESFLATATQRASVLNLAQMFAYSPADPLPATGSVTFQTDSAGPAVLVPAGTQVSTNFVQSVDAPIIFETNTATTVPGTGGTAAIAVTQGQTISAEVLGTSDGTIDQSFRLFNAGVIHGTISLEVGDAINGFYPYVSIAHLLDAGPLDRVFTAYTDENGVQWVTFGDGTNGLVPPNLAAVQATYRIGGGVQGNVAAGSITTIVNAIDGVSIALDGFGNPLSSAMTGGADAESIEQIRVNAPRAFRTQNRCVTLQDYADAALGVSSVGAANAFGNHFSSITVYIVAAGGTTPSAALLAAVLAYLEPRAQAGATISVQAGTPVPINVTLSLNVLNPWLQARVKNDVIMALQNLLSFGQQDFGNRITVSQVYQTIASVPGVSYAALSVMARADAAPTVADAVTQPWEIPVAGAITVSTTNGGVV